MVLVKIGSQGLFKDGVQGNVTAAKLNAIVNLVNAIVDAFQQTDHGLVLVARKTGQIKWTANDAQAVKTITGWTAETGDQTNLEDDGGTFRVPASWATGLYRLDLGGLFKSNGSMPLPRCSLKIILSRGGDRQVVALGEMSQNLDPSQKTNAFRMSLTASRVVRLQANDALEFQAEVNRSTQDTGSTSDIVLSDTTVNPDGLKELDTWVSIERIREVSNVRSA